MEKLDPNAIAPTGIHHEWLGIPEEDRDPRLKDYSAAQIDGYIQRERIIPAPLISEIVATEIYETLDEWDDRDEELTWGQVIREAIVNFSDGLFQV